MALPRSTQFAFLILGMAASACASLGGSSGASGAPPDPFDDTTQVLCPGEDGSVSFQASGVLTMAVRADDPRLAPAVGETPDPLAPDVVTVTLVQKDTARKVSFLKVAGSWDEPVAFAAVRDGDALVARGDKNAAWWSGPRFEVTRVAAIGRPVEVRHAGKVAAIGGGGAASEALSGTPLAGAWELRSELTPDEKAGREPLPRSLRVVATTRCKGKP